MYFPSNNWYVVRRNCVGTWQVEAQQGCFYITCPNQYKARRVQDYLMTWLRDSQYFRLAALCPFVHQLLDNKMTFDEFYDQVMVINDADEQAF